MIEWNSPLFCIIRSIEDKITSLSIGVKVVKQLTTRLFHFVPRKCKLIIVCLFRRLALNNHVFIFVIIRDENIRITCLVIIVPARNACL